MNLLHLTGCVGCFVLTTTLAAAEVNLDAPELARPGKAVIPS